MNGIITQTRVGRLFVDQVAARYYDCYFSVPRDKATGEFFATTDGTLAATWYTDVNAQAVARCGGSLRINLTDVTDDEGVMCYDAAGAYLGFVALPTADAFGYVALPTGTATFRLCLSQGRTYADGVKTADGATFQYRAPTPTTGDELAWMGGEAACAAFGTLSKKRERETGGKYFREKLDGQITIYGEDFRRIATLGVEDYARLRLYRTTEGQQQQTATLFYEWDCMKTSCTLDYVRRTAKIASVETDRYTDFLNAYENEYNAIDLAPEIGQLTMTRRPMVQCYRSGEMVVTNIIDQTFFEEDVTEAVASLKNLTETHHFTFSGSVTVGLTGGVSANADLRDVALTTFRGYYFSYADKQTRAYGRFTGGDYTITLDYRRRDTTSDAVPCVTITVASTGNVYTSYRYGASTSYVSDYVAFSQLLPLAFTATRNIIAKNNEALIGTDGLTLTITDPVGEYYRVLAETDGRDVAGFVRDNQTPNVEGAVTYPRMLLAFSADSGSDTTEDDYFVDTETPYDTIVMMDGGTLDVSTLASSEPTRWGKNTDGDYFLRPSSDQLPVCSSTWTDTSYWWSPSTALQAASATLSHGKTIRHAYPLFSVLQRLVEKIDAGVTFTPDAAHSLFFFAERTKLDVDPIDGVGGLFALFAVPMTNVTKDDYDTPAKKMQLSVKALLDMLSDAYQCYWYIDDQRRLRIEHLAYFEQGMSYVPDVDEAVDLTALTDRFNGRQALYGQGEVEYSTDDLASRYELSWGDSGAEYFNDYALDVGGRIVKTASKASVSIADFAADVTMMMAYPSSFSDDSVALVTADADGAVTSEIVPMALDGATATTPTAINNYYASWPFLLRLWRRYVYASKAIDIADFFYDARTTTDITRADFRTTTVTLPDMGYELTGRAVKTLVGTGYVVSSQQDLVTGQVTLEINLPPE